MRWGTQTSAADSSEPKGKGGGNKKTESLGKVKGPVASERGTPSGGMMMREKATNENLRG